MATASLRFLIGTSITLALTAVSGVVWAVRLEGRVNTQETTIAAVKEQAEKSDRQVLEELRYIRMRLDEALDRSGR